MERYPVQVASQQPLLGPLQAIQQAYPVCAAWIALQTLLTTAAPTLSPAALQQASVISRLVAQAFGVVEAATPISVIEQTYLQTLEQTAWTTASQLYLLALDSPAPGVLTLTQAAQNALATLTAWDPVLGTNVPTNPAALAAIVCQGVTVPT